MGLIRSVTPAEAGRFIHKELRAAEKLGFSGKAALAQLVRPGNIAASFGGGIEAVAPVKIDQINLTKQI